MKEIVIVPIQSQPEDIKLIFLNAVLMPNGEIICVGQSLGFYKDFSKFIYTPSN